MTILFVGGGSGGHVMPGVAISREIMKKDPTATIHFVCSSKNEDLEIMRSEKLSFSVLPLAKVSLLFPFQFLKALFEARKILEKIRPDIIFSKGGSLSVPICAVAKRKNIPIVLHESDARTGRANRLVAKWAKVICLGFAPEKNISDPRVHVTGNPVRSEIAQGSKEKGLALTQFSGKKPVLLIMGGSQGAQAINDTILKILPDLRPLCDVIHITGKGKMQKKSDDGYFAVEFVGSDLPHLYAIADLAVSRSGAGSISELSANMIPTILIPIRGLAQDHQYANASRAMETGGFTILDQETLSETLLPTVTDLLNNPAKREAMHMNLQKNSPRDAAATIADLLLS